MKVTHTHLKHTPPYILLYIICWGLLSFTASGQGLKFSGLECRIDERTSLDVFGGHPKTFRDYFEMDFLISTYPKSDFGYICRIKESGFPYRIWNLSYDGRGAGKVSIRINEEGRFSLIKAVFPREDMQDRHWTPVKIKFDLKQDSIYLDIAGHRHSAAAGTLPDKFRPEIYFGKSDYIIDVPTVALRELKISDSHKNYTFLFDEVAGNTARDTRRSLKAKVENPTWMTEESMRWHPVTALDFPTNAGAVYNPHRNEFYYFNSGKIYIINMLTETVEEKTFTSPCPVELILANCFIDNDGSQLYAYELQYEDRDSTRCTVASLDLNSMQWTCRSRHQLNTPMHHHTSFVRDGRHTIFGGFGEMKYNGSFYSLSPDMKWEEIWYDRQDSSTVFPRYFTSCGIDEAGKYLYIFGGMGNESGEQIVGRHYYYDLHRIDMATGEQTRLWEMDRDGDNIVPVRNMVIKGDSLYVLCYPEHISDSRLHLYRFSIADGSYQILDDTIPITSDKILTNANLWYDENLEKLYASTQVYDDDIRSELKIYSLSFPPVFGTDTPKRSILWIIIASVAVLLPGGGSAAYAIAAKKKKRLQEALEEGKEKEQKTEKKIFRNELKANSIYLFGDFMIFDRNGKDATLTFTAQQRQLFCLLLKYSEKNGISSKHLSNILWPDKEEDKVKNSRGVAINHLRKLLKQIDGINLIFTDGHFKFEYDKAFHCDYLELMRLLSEKHPDKDAILDIVSKGKFMAFMNDPVFDTFKEKVEETLSPILMQEIKDRYEGKEYQAVTEIAEMIFHVDPLEQSTLVYLIKSLRKLKRDDEALVQYAKFAAEYRRVYDGDYGVSYDSI